MANREAGISGTQNIGKKEEEEEAGQEEEEEEEESGQPDGEGARHARG